MRVEVVRVCGYDVLIRTYRISNFFDGLDWSVSPATHLPFIKRESSVLRLCQPAKWALTISISLMLAYQMGGCLLSSSVDPFPFLPIASVASPQPRTPATRATPKTPFPVHAGAESPPAAELG